MKQYCGKVGLAEADLVKMAFWKLDLLSRPDLVGFRLLSRLHVSQLPETPYQSQINIA